MRDTYRDPVQGNAFHDAVKRLASFVLAVRLARSMACER